MLYISKTNIFDWCTTLSRDKDMHTNFSHTMYHKLDLYISTMKTDVYVFFPYLVVKLNIYVYIRVYGIRISNLDRSIQFESNTVRFNIENAFLPPFSPRRNENSKINIPRVVTICLPEFPVLCLFFFTLSLSHSYTTWGWHTCAGETIEIISSFLFYIIWFVCV